MNPDRLTQKSQEALHDAQSHGLRLGHTEVDGEHLLLSLVDQPDGLVPPPSQPCRRRRGPATPVIVERDLEQCPAFLDRGRPPDRCS